MWSTNKNVAKRKRTKKETEEGTTEYSLIGSKIMKMEKVTSSGKITMYFTYDQRDELQSVTESNKEYYYIKDITGNTGSNLRHQLAIEEASSNPNEGDVISNIKMKDPRMPYWLGWQKYSYQVYDMYVHYVGNRLFPKWYPYSPWFDYKIK